MTEEVVNFTNELSVPSHHLIVIDCELHLMPSHHGAPVDDGLEDGLVHPLAHPPQSKDCLLTAADAVRFEAPDTILRAADAALPEAVDATVRWYLFYPRHFYCFCCSVLSAL